MGVKPKLVIYTHTDYSDVWGICFGQLEKYMFDFNICVFVNKENSEIPKRYSVITYNESDVYTDRLKYCLSKLSDDVILFTHEDMILFGPPKIDLIEKYSSYVINNLVNSVKLIYVSGSDINSDFDTTLIKNEFSKLSIQPTLISPKNFISLINKTNPLNIWDFEESITNQGKDYMCKIGGELKRGIHHFDSLVFPYIATAIVKGKWNMVEYEHELTTLFSEYGISDFKREMR
jgi:hypothetical protein